MPSFDYQLDGETYQGCLVSPANDALLMLLVHDWDGLTAHEKIVPIWLRELGYQANITAKRIVEF